jgi:MFS family permease
LFYISLFGTAIAILGFFFIDKVDKTRLLIIIAFIYIVPLGLLAYFTATATLTYTLFLWLYGVFSLVSGLSFVTYVALFFDLSSPKVAGTMIAIFLTLNNAGRLFGIMISGFFTISWIYVIAIALTAFRILPLWKIRMADVEKAFYERPRRPFKLWDILIAGIPLAVITIIVLLRFL